MTKENRKSFNNNMRKIKILFMLLSFVTIMSCGGKDASKGDAFDAEKAFAAANELMDKKEYTEARTALFEIKNRDLTKKYAPLAQLRIADSYLKEDELERSIEEYKRFIEIYPEHKYAPYSQYQIAMIYFDQIESPERGYGAASRALAEFQKLKRNYPRNPYKDVVEVRIEKSIETLAEYEFIVGKFYFKKDAYNAAINRLEPILKKFPKFKKEAEVLYHLAVSYKKLGEDNKAAEYLALLEEKYPNSDLVQDAKEELAAIKK